LKNGRWRSRTLPINVDTTTATTDLIRIAGAWRSATFSRNVLLCTFSQDISTIWHPNVRLKQRSHESTRRLTTFIAILDAGVNLVLTVTKVNADFDRNYCRIRHEYYRCERAQCRAVPNVIKGQTVGPIIDAQRGEHTRSIQVRTNLREAADRRDNRGQVDERYPRVSRI
jgi:hypothetical protein